MINQLLLLPIMADACKPALTDEQPNHTLHCIATELLAVILPSCLLIAVTLENTDKFFRYFMSIVGGD